MFSNPPGKDGKGSEILGEKKLVLSAAHRIEDPLEFCDYLLPFARSVGPTIKKRRKIKYSVVKPNCWYLLGGLVVIHSATTGSARVGV